MKKKVNKESSSSDEVEVEADESGEYEESGEFSESSDQESAEDKLITQLKSEHNNSRKQSLEGSMIDPEILQKIIERDSPEMNTVLEEFQKSMEQINTKLKPVLEKIRNQEHQIETSHGMSYLEMKYNLMLSYCSFLTFYLLLKLEGKTVENHPVIGKLVHIKTLFEKLRPLDNKL